MVGLNPAGSHSYKCWAVGAQGTSDPTWTLSFHHWEHLPYQHLRGPSEPPLKPWVGHSFAWYIPSLLLSVLLGSYTLLYNKLVQREGVCALGLFLKKGI